MLYSSHKLFKINQYRKLKTKRKENTMNNQELGEILRNGSNALAKVNRIMYINGTNTLLVPKK